ncbi:MAG: hypothetical protein M3162_02150, partial [Thermoproteota archaeon]|nr:hypothetical protein [Thermoproteota archaeon]
SHNQQNSYIYLILIICTSPRLEPKRTTTGFTCEQCGITFDNKDDEQEHVKLEHSEHRPPSGCG